MGPSPAEPSEVLMVFGSLMLFMALLALGFWIRDWLRFHPGALRAFGRMAWVKCVALLKQVGHDSGKQCAVRGPKEGTPAAIPGE